MHGEVIAAAGFDLTSFFKIYVSAMISAISPFLGLLCMYVAYNNLFNFSDANIGSGFNSRKWRLGVGVGVALICTLNVYM